jgi:multidrug resistance efflux pump
MRRDYVVFFAILALCTAAGCRKKPTPAPVPAPVAPKISVETPKQRPVARVVEQPGTVQAFEETALFAKLPGYVGSIEEDPEKLAQIAQNTPEKEVRPKHDRNFDIGSLVKKDQVLVQLFVPELVQEQRQKDALVNQTEAELTQSKKAHAAAMANVAAANAAVVEAEAGVDRAQASYESWQKELDRITRLVKGGVGDLQTRDQTQEQFRASDAARKEAIARVGSTKAAATKAEADRDKASADVEASKSRVEVAKAEAGRVKALRGYMEIKAPYDGVITQRAVNTGDLVSAMDKVALFTVAKIDPVRVVVLVPEADAWLVTGGQTVQIALQGGAAPGEKGKVIRTSWSLAPGSRTLRTEIDLPNAKGLIRPGMYAYAKLTVELPAAWAVSASAIGKINDEPVMYLVEGGKAVRVAVELLRGDDQFTQIKRYKKPGASSWTDVTGNESIAVPAASLTDGQAVP